MTASVKRAVVLGGGISGLAACFRLIEGARERGISLEVDLLEGSPRFGGVIGTERRAGCLLEKGPDCFLSVKPEGLALCRDLGLEGRLIGTRPDFRRSFILRDGKLLPVPQGFYLLSPYSIGPFLTTPVFSPLGKLRMAMDLILPRRRSEEDESLADFVRRRLGREALERMAQPMVAGIYSADPETLSLEATMPQFIDIEREHRSLILGLRKRMRRSAQEGAGTKASGPRYGLFVSFKEGMEVLVNALLERLPPGSLRPRSPAVSLRREGARWRVGIEGGGEIEADSVCITTPPAHAAGLLREASPRLGELLGTITSGSLTTLNLIFRRDQVSHPLDGMGFVVPALEGRALLACSFSSSKFEDRAPEGKVLLRAFVGGVHGEGALGLSDEDLTSRLLDEVRQILGIQGEPEEAVMNRHPGRMPQYLVRHLEKVGRIEEEISRLPGVALAGNAYRGVGIPDCAKGAEDAARSLLAQMVA